MALLKILRPETRRGHRALAALLDRGGSVVDRKTLKGASRIVRQVERGRDAGLLRAVAKFDGVRVDSVADLRVDRGTEVSGKLERGDLPPGFPAALERAIEAVEAFHEPQVHEGYVLERPGARLEEKPIPYRRVGLYVPGGRFPYPSSVVMSVIPARLAGVEQIVVVTPPRAWQESPALRYTLERLGVDEVWGMGGAQAIAALAYGTETIEAVDFIAGPGNAWVAAAKQLVSSRVGIDREAGPSEVVIVAGADAPADPIAADLLAQAEHDPNAMAVLVTDDRSLARAVAKSVDRRLAQLPTADVARSALRSRGAIFLASDVPSAFEVAERLAPEHLQLIGEEVEAMADRIRCAGAVFVGVSSPVVLGDYVAGPSHVLPTGGTARFASGLGVDDFRRRLHIVRYDSEAVVAEARAAAVLAEVEGLMAHAASARLRIPADGEPGKTEVVVADEEGEES